MNEPNKGETYTGPSGGIKKPSEWLASEDLPAETDVEVTIEDVRRFKDVKFEGGRAVPVVGALKFAGKEKLMILNATNRKRLVAQYTTDTKKWRGVKVALYVKPDCKNPSGGAPIPGIRIR